jgi:hypothetical protein
VEYSEEIGCTEKILSLISILKILPNSHLNAVDPKKQSALYPLSLHLATGII